MAFSRARALPASSWRGPARLHQAGARIGGRHDAIARRQQNRQTHASFASSVHRGTISARCHDSSPVSAATRAPATTRGECDSAGRAPSRRSRTYGPLQLCEHQLPSSHQPGCRPAFAPSPITPGRRYVERTERWRHFARQAGALVQIANALHHEKLPKAEQWREVYREAPVKAPWWQRSLTVDRLAFSLVVREWLRLSSVTLWFSWNRDQPDITLDAPALFDVLTVRLLTATLATGGIFACSARGHPFIPARRPRADQRRYCAACRQQGRDHRDARAAYRARLPRSQRIATESATGGHKTAQGPSSRHKNARQSPARRRRA